jgi:hypothetical protein
VTWSSTSSKITAAPEATGGARAWLETAFEKGYRKLARTTEFVLVSNFLVKRRAPLAFRRSELMPYFEPKVQRNPGPNSQKRGDDLGLDASVVTLVERQRRLLLLRQRAIKAAGPGLPDARSRIPGDAA